ncbi:hypothetical protein EJ02DRAFT_460240 [Clathrospora elynae]|uniref:Uncharacterized protein n=1 Tax=Clathrospora elynae TaxID=706981 RepID=A0A6A5S4M6_9PLEO|nr:hypothetical protein EJ02DRAFT_460240 [Clathrospora elynae]
MGPDTHLPLPAKFTDTDQYVDSLLQFTTTSWLHQTLCGGVHILDFYTRSPDLYSHILPQSWREWFKTRDIMDILIHVNKRAGSLNSAQLGRLDLSQ